MSLTAEIKPFPISEDARAFLDSLAEQRKQRILALLEKSSVDKPLDPVFAAIIVDMEHSATTTNMAMLAMIGCDVARPAADASDDDVDDVIAKVVSGLAAWNVFLLGSDAFDSRKLIDILFDGILRDEVKLIPPDKGFAEIVDLNHKGLEITHDRDRFFPRAMAVVDSDFGQ